MWAKKIKIILSGLFIVSGLAISGYSLFFPSIAVEADEYLPTDFLEDGDKFKIIIEIDSNKSGSITYSYEFTE